MYCPLNFYMFESNIEEFEKNIYNLCICDVAESYTCTTKV